MSMRMSFGQEMRMAQKQVLAPRMIQSMEILQLPLLALEERIEQEIQNNETLELVEPETEGNSPTESVRPSLHRQQRLSNHFLLTRIILIKMILNGLMIGRKSIRILMKTDAGLHQDEVMKHLIAILTRLQIWRIAPRPSLTTCMIN